MGVGHRLLFGYYNDLGGLYFKLDRLGEAETMYKRALAIREKALGADNPNLTYYLDNLTSVYRAQGRYGAAEPIYQRIIAL